MSTTAVENKEESLGKNDATSDSSQNKSITPASNDVTKSNKQQKSFENKEEQSSASSSPALTNKNEKELGKKLRQRKAVNYAESSEEDESDDDDDDFINPLFEGLNTKDIKKFKKQETNIKENYAKNMILEREKKLIEIKNTILYNIDEKISDEEASFIYDFTKKHQINLNDKIETEGIAFVKTIKEMIHEKKLLQQQQLLNGVNKKNKKNNGYKSDSEYEYDENDYQQDSEYSDDDDDEEFNPYQKKKKRKRNTNNGNNNNNNNNNNGERKKGHNLDGSERCGRLLLDDALKNVTNFDGWSAARIKAWKNKKKHPNAYYYRFNDIDVKQKKGGFVDKNEIKLYMERIKEMGTNDKWGIFSMTLPGRVGYQCSNYWRQLVKEGKVYDPNYYFDNENKIKFKTKDQLKLSKKDFAAFRSFSFTVKKDIPGPFKIGDRHPKCPKNIDELIKIACADDKKQNDNNKGGKKGSKKGKKKSRNNDDDNDNYGPPKKKRRRNTYTSPKNEEPIEKEEHILPGFKDVMTGEEVIRPAISPFGHVMGYETWTKILRNPKTKEICPFTKKRLTRRQLVKLTKENINQYKNKIINVTTNDIK